jgi:hypothetical protein
MLVDIRRYPRDSASRGAGGPVKVHLTARSRAWLPPAVPTGLPPCQRRSKVDPLATGGFHGLSQGVSFQASSTLMGDCRLEKCRRSGSVHVGNARQACAPQSPARRRGALCQEISCCHQRTYRASDHHTTVPLNAQLNDCFTTSPQPCGCCNARASAIHDVAVQHANCAVGLGRCSVTRLWCCALQVHPSGLIHPGQLTQPNKIVND